MKVFQPIVRYLDAIESDARKRYPNPSQADFASRLQALCLIGAIAVPTFFGLDILLWLYTVRDMPIALTGALRMLDCVFFILGHFLLGRGTYSTRTLLAFELLFFLHVAVLMGLLSLITHGIGSTYYAGITILLWLRALALPSSLRHTFAILAALLLTYNGTLATGAILVPEIAAQFSQPAHTTAFFANNIFLVLELGLAFLSAIIVFRLRQRTQQALDVGRYQIKKILGKGAMGHVYLAEIGALRRPCAIKIIHATLAQSDIVRQRFQREAEQTSMLNHPHTISIFDSGSMADGSLYYTMEFLDGLDLSQVLEHEKRLPPARALHFLLQACDSVYHAHSNGIIHRDLKPENCLILGPSSQPDFLKILDFGLAKAFDAPKDLNLTSAGSILGTPPYLSPELAMGLEADPRSDQYSLGAVLYRLLTGEYVHVGVTPMEMIMSHVWAQVTPPSKRLPTLEISQTLEDTLLRALARKPEDRFPSVLAFRNALSKCPEANKWTQQDAQLWWKRHKNTVHNPTHVPNDPTDDQPLPTHMDLLPQRLVPQDLEEDIPTFLWGDHRGQNPLPTGQPHSLPPADTPTFLPTGTPELLTMLPSGPTPLLDPDKEAPLPTGSPSTRTPLPPTVDAPPYPLPEENELLTIVPSGPTAMLDPDKEAPLTERFNAGPTDPTDEPNAAQRTMQDGQLLMAKLKPVPPSSAKLASPFSALDPSAANASGPSHTLDAPEGHPAPPAPDKDNATTALLGDAPVDIPPLDDEEDDLVFALPETKLTQVPVFALDDPAEDEAPLENKTQPQPALSEATVTTKAIDEHENQELTDSTRPMPALPNEKE